MEIIPGVGLPPARLGETLDQIAARNGSASARDAGTVQWRRHSPPFGVGFDGRGRAELVEVYLGDAVVHPTTVRGVQLVGRSFDDVVADLAAVGLHGHGNDFAVEFAEGFTLWTLWELSTHDVHVAPGAKLGVPLVEGVAVTGLDPAPRTTVGEMLQVSWPPALTS